MPSPRLLLCGLLSKYPEKSSVFQKIITIGRGQRYTDAEKMHIVAMMWTPELPLRWIWHQFEPHISSKKDHFMARLRRIQYHPEYRSRWEHLGEQNIQFIGQPEVERYYLRRPPGKTTYPFWAVPVLRQHVKGGMKQAEVDRMYNLPYKATSKIMRKSIFDRRKAPPHTPRGVHHLQKG